MDIFLQVDKRNGLKILLWFLWAVQFNLLVLHEEEEEYDEEDEKAQPYRHLGFSPRDYIAHVMMMIIIIII